MSDTIYCLWCHVEGDSTAFPLSASSSLYIGQLKDVVKEKRSDVLQRVDASSLTLWKVQVDVDLDEVDDAGAGQYQLDAKDRRQLRVKEKLFEVWPEPPRDDQLHVFISLPQPGLDPDAYDIFKVIRNLRFLDAYFGRLERRTVEDVSPEESTFESESESQRLAGYLEVGHLVSIASGKWERYWRGTLGNYLKEPLMTGLFFQDFALHAGGSITAQTYGHSANFILVVTFSSPNQIFLDSLCRLIRNQSKIGLRILFGCF
ncbi:hypothetical protein F5888DRAFT_1248949 [Russula emetica]|nr:hypothetical protein F5888DRAFT_1248949 [Russula emetica]